MAGKYRAASSPSVGILSGRQWYRLAVCYRGDGGPVSTSVSDQLSAASNPICNFAYEPMAFTDIGPLFEQVSDRLSAAIFWLAGLSYCSRNLTLT
ncbi:hypothetical protein ACOMHN_034968 [Nucella lapillus]